MGMTKMSQVVKWLKQGEIISVSLERGDTSVRVTSVGPDGWIKGMVTYADMYPNGWKDTDELVYVNLNQVAMVIVECETKEEETDESNKDETTE